ncbi:hypothetical protein [Pseudorhodobacter sp.]|uniref:hypothetical protein n=1 Tax=Pseudorhodobacter sp. TaxID=1934400 RepID=UPI002649D040|nr:hypothetical protein [Pseudorhodobacter sp.]MDN5786593.1 hypothetical protein [Pseudorhodobacter sp.]
MMICNADFDELFDPVDQSNRRTGIGSGEAEARVAVFPFNDPEATQANIAQSAMLAAAVMGAAWSMVETISRM